MQLSYNHLYYFYVAAIEGTVAAAAARLGVTQPTVSEQLRSLERALGNELFERTQAGLKLTDAGRMAFELTSRMFRFGERLVDLFAPRELDAPRMLRIGASHGVARSMTTDFLLPLLALDGCVPSLRTSDTVELLRDLRGGLLDLVLCESEPAEPMLRGLDMAVLDRIALVAIAPRDLEPTADWHDVQLLQYRAGSPLRLDVEAFLDHNGFKPRIAAEADDALVLLELAARGGYVAIVPRALAAGPLEAGRIKLLATVEPSNIAVHALYQDAMASGVARRAVDALLAHARAE